MQGAKASRTEAPVRRRERREEMSADQETMLEKLMGLPDGVPIPEPVRCAYFAVKRSMDRIDAGLPDVPMMAIIIAMGTMKEWFPRAEEPAPSPSPKPVASPAP